MQDKNLLERYCENGNWDKADAWLCKELVVAHRGIVRRRISGFVFSVLWTAVLFCITWTVLFPECNGIQTAKFPFFNELNSATTWVRQLVPVEGGGGNAIAILGALVLPFAVWGIFLLLTLLVNPRKYVKKKTVNDAQTIKDKVTLLDNMRTKHNDAPIGILASFWVISSVGGWIMSICASPNSENTGRYVGVGLVCAALYAAVFFGGLSIVSGLYSCKEIPFFSRYDYLNDIRRANGEPTVSYSSDDTPTSTGFVMDEETIQTILDDVYGDCGGKYGKY